MSKYKLRCLGTQDRIEDEYTVRYHDKALLRAEYANELTPRDLPGLWRWVDWLPVSKPGRLNAGSICFKSEGLASELMLSNLWISFHGYWPERGAMCPTTTFKDMEAVTTLQRLEDHGVPGLICSSAGNTARAFAHFGGWPGIPSCWSWLKSICTASGSPRVIRWKASRSSASRGDYGDATEVTSKIMEVGGWRREGGVHNVARRDGIGSLILTAIEAMGGMPKHYFQGVGGGPGPIGIHEMAQRAIEAGFAEGPVPRQHLSQNAEFCLVHDAWQKRTFELTPETEAIHPRVFSDVLLNRAPAYSVRGGLFDMLVESNGATYAVDYDDAAEAFDLFKRTEGIDPFSAGAVALASLKQAIYRGEVHRDDTILLNISGGGGARFMAEHETEAIAPIAVVDKEEAVRLGRSFTYSNQ